MERLKDKTPEDIRAEHRADLLKRLFAVAISVGAASTLINMDWIKYSQWPSHAEWKQLSVLLVALMVTVLSWDGYLWAIYNRPLKEFWRFLIDILLVFIYMIMLITSKNQGWWLPILVIIFGLYILWDLLTVLYQPEYYDSSIATGKKRSIWRVYIGGACNRDGIKRGPVMTLVWAICIFFMMYMNKGGIGDRVFSTSLIALLVLVIYRVDKIKQFRMTSRLGLAILPVALQILIVTGVDWTKDEVITRLLPS